MFTRKRKQHSMFGSNPELKPFTEQDELEDRETKN
jgi:hypothetical protein